MADNEHSTAQNKVGEKEAETMAQRLSRIQSEPQIPLRKQPSVPTLGASTPTSYGNPRERSSTSSLPNKSEKSGLTPSVLGAPEYPITREGEEDPQTRPVIGEFIQVPSKFNIDSVGSLASSLTEGSSTHKELKPHTMLISKAFISYEDSDGKFEPFYNISGYWVRSFSRNSAQDPAGIEKHKHMHHPNVEPQRVLLPSVHAPPTTNPSFNPPLKCTYVAERTAWADLSCEATIRLPKDKFVKRFKPPGKLAPGEFARLEQYRMSLPAMAKEKLQRLEYARWMCVPVGSFATGKSDQESGSYDIVWTDVAKLLEESMIDPETKRQQLEDRVLLWMESISME